jgi:hypothetical protein
MQQKLPVVLFLLLGLLLGHLQCLLLLLWLLRLLGGLLQVQVLPLLGLTALP